MFLVRETAAVLAATVSGIAMVLAFAPAGVWFLAPPALAVLFYLAGQAASVGRAFIYGLAFGFAFFISGLWWIFQALSGYIGLPVIAAAAIIIVFSLALALFPALSLAAARQLVPAGFTRLLMFAAFWTLTEWLRSWWLTGFPWLAVGYSQIPSSPLAAWAPIFGILGVGFSVCLTAVCLVAVFFMRRRRLHAAGLLLVVWLSPLLYNLWQWTAPAGTLNVSLLQGNVKQALKWQPGQVKQALDDYLEMADSAAGRVVILPETALPMLPKDLPDGYLSALENIAAERLGAVIAGIFLSDDSGGLYNSALVLEKKRRVGNDYRKTHLTPYGEYLPLPAWLREWLLPDDIPDIDLSPGRHHRPLSLPDGIIAGISICYEDLFGEEWRQQMLAAHFLINMTNDGWFEDSIMLQQHLQISQARALESGRWLVRATNTGETAVIDANGEVVASLPPQVRGVLTHQIRLFRGATPYVLLGDIAVVIVAAAVIAAGGLLAMYRRWRAWRSANSKR